MTVFNTKFFDLFDLTFYRINEEEDIEPPQFGGAKGPEYERGCRKIEEKFCNALKKIEDMKDKIFDMQSTEWCKAILEFRNTTKHIEVIGLLSVFMVVMVNKVNFENFQVLIENLMFSLFEEINNVEEAIQILSAVLNYLKRENLSDCLTKTVSQVN